MNVIKKATTAILVFVIGVGIILPMPTYASQKHMIPMHMDTIMQNTEYGSEQGESQDEILEEDSSIAEPDIESDGIEDGDATITENPDQEPDDIENDTTEESDVTEDVMEDDDAEKAIPEEVESTFDTAMPKARIKVDYANGIHSIIEPDYPDERMVLYCMNNLKKWPHVTPDTPVVPDYINWHLTPDQFENEYEYQECIRKLQKILFAGYPYNAERLYKIVDSDNLYTPTEAEFNEMLLPLSHLIEVFPELGHHSFTLDDKYNPIHLDVLRRFVADVKKLYPDGKTANGLTYQDITSMPFYKAAYCLTYETDDPLKTFSQLFPNSYFMNENQAYDSTQDAVWKLLNDYGIEGNNFSDIENDEFAKILTQYSENGTMLDTEPEYADIYIEGELKFTYHEEDQKWHTGKIKIVEPPFYHGVYDMTFPNGVTLRNSKLTHVYGNEEYELISTREVQPGEIFTGTVNYYWMKDFRQYTPIDDSRFQNMTGSIVRSKSMNFSVLYGVNDIGDLEVTKSVAGKEEDQQKQFSFILTLNGAPINGIYGGLMFQDGVAAFTLQHGESKYIANLPAGVSYTLTEVPNDNYKVEIQNGTGTIIGDQTIQILCKNTKIADTGSGTLRISKSVVGTSQDQTQEFPFTLTLTDCPINGTYGDLTFTNGVAEFTLKHGESKTAKDLPAETAYIVTEAPNNSYKVEMQNGQGIIAKDQTIQILCENTKIKDVGNGALTISKSVTGTAEDQTQEFPFTLTLTDCPINGTYGDLTFTNGAAEFTLKHGESKTAKDLPAQTAYIVTEAPNDSYKVEVENVQGTIEEDQIVTVSFINTKISDSNSGNGSGGGGGHTPDAVIPPTNKPHKPNKPEQPEQLEQPEQPDQPQSKITEEQKEIPDQPVIDDSVDLSTDQSQKDPQSQVERKEKAKIPQTGDASHLGFWIGVFVIAFVSLYHQVRKKHGKVE